MKLIVVKILRVSGQFLFYIFVYERYFKYEKTQTKASK